MASSDVKNLDMTGVMVYVQALKQLREKVSKGKAEEDEVVKMETAQKTEVINFNKTCSSEVRFPTLSLFN